MRKRNVFLAVLAVVMALTASLGSAWAYFTTYAEAKGGYTIELGARTELKEDFEGGVKHVVVSSREDSSEAVFVRARADAGTEYALNLNIHSESGKWTDGGDGWWYYSDPLEPGADTEELLVAIEGIPHKADTPGLEDGDTFDVVVLYEYTRALYHEDGTAYADWTRVLDNGEGGGV